MMDIKAIREYSGLDRNAFCAKYSIPYRTLQNWELGEREAPEYVINLLERAVREDYGTAYVFEAYGLETPFIRYSGSLQECAEYVDGYRKTIKPEDRYRHDVYIKTAGEIESEKRVRARYDSLTPEERQDIIEVDGKRYIRKIYEANKEEG